MAECLADCWICNRNKDKCSLENSCQAVFDGKGCQMEKVCNPKPKKCPLVNKQAELFDE
jgi:hypothetical protein